MINKEETISRLTAFQAELTDLGTQLNKLEAMGQVLSQDMIDCEQLIKARPEDEGVKRSFIRCVFALIEGSVFNLKETALTLAKHGRGKFSHGELAMLEEVSYDLGDKGEAREQPKFIQLTKNVRFAFSAAARAFQVTYELAVDDKEWSTFKDAIAIRNRITHPKSVDDLKLSDDEVQVVADAGSWFLKNKHTLLQKFIDRMSVLKSALDKSPSAH